MGIILPIFFLCIIGLIALKSTSIDALGETSVFKKQIVWIFAGSLIFMAIQFLRVRLLYEYAYILYFFQLLLLSLTLFSPEINNSTRCIDFGVFQFQPSEIGKIIMVVFLARFIADYKDSLSDHQLIISVIFFSLIPLSIIFNQPDYGTGIIYFLPLVPMLYWSDVKVKNLIIYMFPLISIVTAFHII